MHAVELINTTGTSLGMTLSYPREGQNQSGRYISYIKKDGFVDQWNAQHPPAQQLCVGDRIITVNGQCTDAGMMREFQSPQMLKIVLMREGQGNFVRLTTKDLSTVDKLVTHEMLDSLEQVQVAECGDMAECCICLEDLQDGEQIVRLPCKHVFHGSCARQWLMQGLYATDALCPLCKRNFGGCCQDCPELSRKITNL